MDHIKQDPVPNAHKEMGNPGAVGIANGLMNSALKRVSNFN